VGRPDLSVGVPDASCLESKLGEGNRKTSCIQNVRDMFCNEPPERGNSLLLVDARAVLLWRHCYFDDVVNMRCVSDSRS